MNGPAIAAAGEGLAAAWFTGAADGQRVRAAFVGKRGELGEPVDVAVASTDTRPVGRVDIAGDLDGTAIVLWLSAEGEDGRVRVRRVAADGRVGAPVALGPTGTARAAGFPRLVRTKDGFVAAWAGDAGIVAVRFPSAAVPPVEASPVAAATAPPPTKTLPPFDLADLAGQRVRAVDLLRRPVLLSVWATWCGPCREELPELVRLQTAHPDVAVVALSVDGTEAGDAVRKMTERLAPGLRVLHPDDGGIAARLGVSALPRTFLFDGKGQLCWGSTGAVAAADPALTEAIAACARR
ncbi:MAG: TlpA family protein disulfide reductase [Myxococcota bacterium]